MISSGLHADGDYRKSFFNSIKTKQMDSIQSIKRMKSTDSDLRLAENFFFQTHPFSDLILLIQDKELHVDKSVLTVASKVFQKYLQDESIESIEIVDVTPNEMIELLQFLYPQFRCTINNRNVTILLILAHRFEIDFISLACRTFILFYLSKFELTNMRRNGHEFIKHEDGTCLSISSILDLLFIWLRDFFFIQDIVACEAILNRLAQCKVSTILGSNSFKDLEEEIKWKIFQVRAKYLENERTKLN